jgi:predicted ABC-class ATPase
MSGSEELERALAALDGRPYGAYRSLVDRRFTAGRLGLRFAHVQSDPFAPPSRLELEAQPAWLSLEPSALSTPDSRRASADFVHRALLLALDEASTRSGSGGSGKIEIATPGPEVLERTAVEVGAKGSIRARVGVGLPAAGRRILGRAAAELLARRLAAALERVRKELDREALARHVAAVEDQVALRASLAERGLVAFLAAGSVLPRRTGVDEGPLPGALPLEVPASLAVELAAPHAGTLRGLAIHEGVTLLVGGGYHGKSTLLECVARGVYDHIPGDGRERCVTRADAVVVRAEDGRSVRGVDLRPFIGELPLGRRTDRFDTDDASGSTSQAAAIVEALEAGARVLLIDEDTAATNFMLRDARMRRLVPDEQEPITPLLDRVRALHRECGVSSVIALGGSGDYFDAADRVIQLDAYRPRDVTERARRVACELPRPRDAEPRLAAWPPPAPRTPDPTSLDASLRGARERVRGRGTRSLEFGREEIELSALAQLVDAAQARAAGDALLALARGMCDGSRPVPELLDAIDARIEREGLASLAPPGCGDRARPRRFEIAGALNRLRSLRLLEPGGERRRGNAPS